MIFIIDERINPLGLVIFAIGVTIIIATLVTMFSTVVRIRKLKADLHGKLLPLGRAIGCIDEQDLTRMSKSILLGLVTMVMSVIII